MDCGSDILRDMTDATIHEPILYQATFLTHYVTLRYTSDHVAGYVAEVRLRSL